MKKFTKITLVISVICIVLGMSLIIGTGMFGDLYYGNIDLNLGLSEEHHDIRLAGNEIREMDITVKAASLEIIQDDTVDGITIVDGSALLDVYHSVEDDTLHLEIKKKDPYKSVGGVIDEVLTLRIPAHIMFEELDMDLSAASLNAERLAAEELNFNLNASSVEIHDVESGTLHVDNNAGSFWMYGTVAQELEVDCNAGAVEMELNDAYAEYNYEVDCKVGAIQVGDREYSGLKSTVTQKNEGAKKNMDLDCNAGEIEIRFAE